MPASGFAISDEANMLSHFEHFLATVPLVRRAARVYGADGSRRGLLPKRRSRNTICGANLTTPAEIVELAREHHSADVCYEVAARWDLWIREMESASWKKKPERLDLFCYGPEYDGGVSAESGHFMADLGFEHLFTGHAGLLTPENRASWRSRSIPTRRDF